MSERWNKNKWINRYVQSQPNDDDCDDDDNNNNTNNVGIHQTVNTTIV